MDEKRRTRPRGTRLRALATALVSGTVIAACPSMAAATREALDPTFGTGGTVRTPIGYSGSGSDYAKDLALQPDGKILVAGAYDTSNGLSNSVLARYLPDGQLDASFASGGLFTRDLAGGTFYDRFSSVVVQPDGKLIAVGGAVGAFGPMRFVAVRVNSNGTLDTSFSGDGIQSINPSPTVTGGFSWSPENTPEAVLAPDGDLIMVGTGNYESGPTQIGNIAAVRLDPNGELDPGFGTGGIANAPLPLPADVQQGPSANAVAIQPDGRIIVGGSATTTAGGFTGLLVRLLPNGAPDPSFAAGGVRAVPSMSFASAVTVASDGRILLGGTNRGLGGGDDFVVSRFNSDGSTDAGFSSDGTTSIDFPGGPLGDFFPESVEAIAALPDGKVVVGGSGDGFLVARLTSSGELDSARARFPGEPSGSVPTALAMVVQPDGKPILGGFDAIPGFADGIALKRVESLGQPDPPVDEEAPETEITKVKANAKKLSVQVKFRGSDNGGGVTFECRFDTRRWKACESPFNEKVKKPGKYKFEVRAIDASGNFDRSPAVEKIKLKKPKKSKGGGKGGKGK